MDKTVYNIALQMSPIGQSREKGGPRAAINIRGIQPNGRAIMHKETKPIQNSSKER